MKELGGCNYTDAALRILAGFGEKVIDHIEVRAESGLAEHLHSASEAKLPIKQRSERATCGKITGAAPDHQQLRCSAAVPQCHSLTGLE